MIPKQYFEGLFLIKPLPIAADLTETSIEQALIEHNFKLEDTFQYLLLIGRENISELLKLNAGYNLFNIQVELQEDLRDEWYLVCENTKTIVYSPGA